MGDRADNRATGAAEQATQPKGTTGDGRDRHTPGRANGAAAEGALLSGGHVGTAAQR